LTQLIEDEDEHENQKHNFEIDELQRDLNDSESTTKNRYNVNVGLNVGIDYNLPKSTRKLKDEAFSAGKSKRYSTINKPEGLFGAWKLPISKFEVNDRPSYTKRSRSTENAVEQLASRGSRNSSLVSLGLTRNPILREIRRMWWHKVRT
jgi:hypothetical protein